MGHQVQPEEATAIVRRLDIDGDLRVGYNEFVEALTPVSSTFKKPARAARVAPPKNTPTVVDQVQEHVFEPLPF